MKIAALVYFLTFTSFLCAQEDNIDFNSYNNIKKFADYLFCDKDYLRAAIEYQRLLNSLENDTVRFKVSISYSYIGDYLSAIENFSKIPSSSALHSSSKLERMKINFLVNDFLELRSYYNDNFSVRYGKYQNEGEKLFNFSYLFTGDELPSKDEFLSPFNLNEKEEVSSFYDWKEDPPYKSSTVAGIMSAIIPGSGKIYIGETGDGIVGFLTTTLFAFIAYDNFKAGHNTRAWIWSGVTALFYAGNVYGSVAAAQVHNAKITFEYNEGLNVFLQSKNYYTPAYDFCE